MAQINLVGKSILGYKVTEKLGEGAFGTVYKVVKTNVSGQYIRALKHITIPTEKQYSSILNSMGGNVSKADNYFKQMLNDIVSEIQILNNLSEKGVQNIVRYYENDIEEINSPKRYNIYILMEYLTPLEDYIKKKEFTVCDVVRLGLEVLNGLQECHNNNIMHRDIKEENIFISDKNEYKIGDFGVSKVLKDSSKAESLKGTPNFLAPEVYLGKEGYTKSVDLYALGIVLYRLLNYNRNPFLPPFPQQFFSDDENKAFEERMSGKTPNIPAFGGNQIGHVIIKAISNKEERFQNAKEFSNALELALSNTPADILDEKVTFYVYSDSQPIRDEKPKMNTKTIGEDVKLVIEENIEEASNEIHQHLFDSIGEIGDIKSKEIPQIEKIEEIKNISEKTDKETIKDITSIHNESKAPIKAKLKNKLVFLNPIMIMLLGIILELYGILWWIWLAAFISSLFFVGKRLQVKSKINATEIVLKKREVYLIIKEAYGILKRLKKTKNNPKLDMLLYEMKKLEERLSVESDFGYGKSDIINCENAIGQYIKLLLKTISDIKNEDFDKEIDSISVMIGKINSLLDKRIELKKH